MEVMDRFSFFREKAKDWIQHRQKVIGVNVEGSVMRVNQLDAIELDEEVYRIVKQQLARVFVYLPDYLNGPLLWESWKPEFDAFIRFLLFAGCTGRGKATPGEALQNLTYDFTAMGWKKRVMFCLISVFVPYTWKKWSQILTRGDWGGYPIGSKEHQIWLWSRRIETAVKTFAVLNFIVFLARGDFSSFVKRTLGIKYSYEHKRVSRQISFDFMNQQLVWHGISEFLLFFLPLLNLRKLRKVLKEMLGVKATSGEGGSDSCGICGAYPILIPYETNCKHLYCYYCIESRRIAESEYRCAICDSIVNEMRRM